MTDPQPSKCSLADRECVPCRGGVPALEGEALAALCEQLGPGWDLVDGTRLTKEFEFPDFRQALGFTNRVGELAESVGHHPDIFLAWGRVQLTLWTHKAGGLTETDFVFAARADRLTEAQP